MKDAVENCLHQQVCRGTTQLADAQRAIARNWLDVYTSRGLKPEATPVGSSQRQSPRTGS
jgi:hypothetical protein